MKTQRTEQEINAQLAFAKRYRDQLDNEIVQLQAKLQSFQPKPIKITQHIEFEIKPTDAQKRGASDLRRQAEEIGNKLFVNVFWEEAYRLVLEMQNGGNGGGWCKGAVVDTIHAALLKVRGEK